MLSLKSKKIFIPFLSFVIVLSICIYRAYIVHQECQHNVKALNDNHERIKLTDSMIKRLQRALQFKTISYSRGKEELEAKLDYVNYIRKGNKIKQINIFN